MKKHIPNTLTCLNVFSGSIASVMAFEGNYLCAVIWVMMGAIFDFFDGFSARLLKAYSPIGKDLDSLADMITFGLAPALIVFRFLSDISPLALNGGESNALTETIPFISFILVVFSALRLAKFNNDTRQSTSFIGLNTPSNAIFWMSLCYSLNISSQSVQIVSFYPIIALIFIMSFLLISEIPMFSLKIKNLKWKGNECRYILLALSIISVSLFGFLGMTLAITFYIILATIDSKINKTNN